MKDAFDYWSIPHFLFGIVAAMFAVLSGMTVFFGFVLTFAIAVTWELLEMRFKLRESIRNVVSDVALPLAAFPFAYSIFEQMSDPEHRAGIFFVTVVVYLYTNYAAWRARMEGDRDFLS